MMTKNDVEKFRIDKWLHAARFFKTRSLAADAVERGKVQINGMRVKPSKTVATGDKLMIRIGPYQYEIEVLALSNKRSSATEAQKLYQETDESRKAREKLTEQIKVQSQQFYTKGRPTKRDRREIERFRNQE
ncbi:MAG TPA: RNA-binding S4 domain-containing protein [Nitrosomonas nitrosa]|jgi:ribosome-associated heat shock protein Hsp15|uniref:Heat shock protein Hsp15 n=1 Tax=Nitrosomonas nitrosa TaxID=52442 RepID=A0A1I4P0M0_9PROT|nr:RNA-binding S4 domain-containing protein [Nitrosomonas nitrosa]MCO6433146.1 RNA-binding S4 domain-containing protein [Nitrosomonas nitrosa]PTR00755.1 heat shock protein Hsp15 [Nitrosomonas nitrosa]SFM21351.1 heat shock protein Hsp15 [Nitrosomonas nitrosa]HBZ30339.1 RNA-binding S4 domain-containing protein [Nitrosomonas nitrosa]HNP50593.1 RNA-binding S4 domain-containing protein [Nitrosomonas nitrosa]